MAKNSNPVAVEVNETIKTAINTYGDASKLNKETKAVMDENKPTIVNAAVETYNANMNSGVKSVNMTSGKYVAQVTFAASFTLKTDVPAFDAAKKIACITEEKSLCIRADKATEVLAFLQSLGRADLLVETTAYSFNREIFDAMEKTPTYANRADLLACLEEKSITTLKIK